MSYFWSSFIKKKPEYINTILSKFQTLILIKTYPFGFQLFYVDRRTDEWTNIAKLVVAFPKQPHERSTTPNYSHKLYLNVSGFEQKN